MKSVLHDTDNCGCNKNKHSESKGDNKVTGEGKGVGKKTEVISCKNKKEQAKNIWCENNACIPGRGFYNICDEMKGTFLNKLSISRHNFSFSDGEKHTQHKGCNHHDEGRIRKRDIVSHKIEGNKGVNLKLM